MQINDQILKVWKMFMYMCLSALEDCSSLCALNCSWFVGCGLFWASWNGVVWLAFCPGWQWWVLPLVLNTEVYRSLSYTALGPGAHFIHPALLPKVCSILLWGNHLNINPSQASNEAMSLDIPLCFISLCGPAGWWPHMMYASKALELLPLESELWKNHRNTLFGCYRQHLLQKMYWVPLWSFNPSWNTMNTFAGVKLCPTIWKHNVILLILHN